VGSGSAKPLTALLLTALLPGCGRTQEGPNLLLVSIDTCRADHLSAYGYARETSPQLDELAAAGVLFEAAYCQVPDTTPSHASLLTSTFPDRHGSANGLPLGTELPTLAEVLRERGFATAAFVSGATMTAAHSGLERGFEVYDDRMTAVGSNGAEHPNERPARQTTARALRWLDRRDAARPFFLFVHYFDPHALYAPPAPYDTLFAPSAGPRTLLSPEDVPSYARLEGLQDLESYVARYDGEIRYVDDQLRRLLEHLREQGVLEDTVIAVTADHGEDLGEHELWFSHGWRLYDPSLHVPLVIAAPGRLPAGLRVPDPVQSVDLLPTLLELLGVAVPASAQGASLLDLVRAPGSDPGRALLARTTKTRTYLRLSRREDLRDFRALRAGGWKYVESEDGQERALFDLRSDAGETRDVLGEHGRDAARLEGQLQALLVAIGQPAAGQAESAVADEELIEDLRALGYVR